MPKTARAPLSISCVSAWLCWPLMSMPTFFRAVTEFSEMGSPVRLATPAEMTLSERKGSG